MSRLFFNVSPVEIEKVQEAVMNIRILLPNLLIIAKSMLATGVTPTAFIYGGELHEAIRLDFTSETTVEESALKIRQKCKEHKASLVVIMYETFYLEQSSYKSNCVDPTGSGLLSPEYIHIIGYSPFETLLLEQAFYRDECGTFNMVGAAEMQPNVSCPILKELWVTLEA